MNKPATFASLKTWRFIRTTIFLASFISQTSIVTTKLEQRNSSIARLTRLILVSPGYITRVTGCWEERLAWSTGQSTVVFQNIGSTRQRRALFLSSVAGGAWLVSRRE